MLLALDIGNTNVTAGCFDGAGLLWRQRAATAEPPDRALTVWFAGAEAPARAVVAGVVPAAADAWQAALEQRGWAVDRLRAADAALLPVDYDPPASLGIDRWLAALAARERFGVPVIVVDAGTATTIDAIDAAGTFRGGAILIGLELAREALAAGTALLPAVPLEVPRRAAGRTTIEALQSGLVLGHAAGVAGLVRRLRDELDLGAAPVIGTGGRVGLLAAAESNLLAHIEPDLVLWGLALAAERRGTS